MAQYKVPQDVEAEDRLLGPFTFRQFIYLIIAAALIALAWALFQLFPLLAIIPLPGIALFAILALPLKKDQPMETDLAALVSFYLKPHKRFWRPGQSESTILITAPKQTEERRTRDITEEEASHRLSFLADIVDTEGYSIRNSGSAIKEEYVAEANATADMFSGPASTAVDQMIAAEQQSRHNELVNQMRTAIARADAAKDWGSSDANNSDFQPLTANLGAVDYPSNAPNNTPAESPTESTIITNTPFSTPEPKPVAPDPSLVNLANNTAYSVETIQKEANRLVKKDNNEIYISLH